MKLHLKTHEDNVPVPCPIEGCQDKIYQVENKNGYSFVLYKIFFEHLKNIHHISMITHTLSQTFRCKICSKYEEMMSIQPEHENSNFWNYMGKNWGNKLHRHLAMEHQEMSKKIRNFKREWVNHFEKGSISIEQRKADEKIELQKIVQGKCKLCLYQAPEWTVQKKDHERRLLLRHYCSDHFSEPLQYFVREYISDNHCLKCAKSYSFKSNTEQLTHVGYIHGELYSFLKADSEIDLTLYIEKKDVVKEEETFPCEECGTVFKLKSRLKTHLIYHSDERPFNVLNAALPLKV